jgi:hypothetical protein
MRRSHPAAAQRSALAAGALLLLACADPAGPEGRFAPTEPAVLSVGSPLKDEDPNLLRAQDGSLYVAWFSERTAPGDIYVTRTGQGNGWSAPVRVTTSSGGDFSPSLIQDGRGVFHLAWFRWTAPFRGHIWYNSSPDGVTWNSANEVQVTTGADVDDWVPTLVEGGDGALLIYFASAKRTAGGTVTDIYVARRAPGQTTWAAAVPAGAVNSAAEHDHLPFATRVGDQVALTWVRHDTSQPLPWLNTKSDVYYATSTLGTAFSPPLEVTHESGRVVNLFPGIYATESGGPAVNWLSTRGGSPELFEQASALLGQYPNGVSRVSQVGAGYSHRIIWTGTPGVYLAVWVSGPEGSQDISYRFFER